MKLRPLFVACFLLFLRSSAFAVGFTGHECHVNITSGTSGSCSITVTAHKLIYATLAGLQNLSPSVSDGTHSYVNFKNSGNFASCCQDYAWWADTGTAGGTYTVTVSNSSHSAGTNFKVAEYDLGGVVSLSSSMFNAQTGNSTSATSGNIVTLQANTIIIGHLDCWNGCSAGSGFTIDTSTGVPIESKIVSSAGTYQVTGTQSPANNFSIIGAAFDIYTGGGPLPGNGYLQKCDVQLSNLNSGACTFPSAVSPNHLIIGIISGTKNDVPTWGDSNSDSYSNATSTAIFASCCQQYGNWATTGSYSGALSVQITNYSFPSAGSAVSFFEYNLEQTPSQDQAANNTGTGTSLSSGSFTTANARDMLMGGCGFISAGTWSPGSGFTQRDGSTQGSTWEDELVNVTGSYAVTSSFSVSTSWGCLGWAFKHGTASVFVLINPYPIF